MGKNLASVLIIVTAILLAAVGYYIFQNQKLLTQLARQTVTPTPLASSVPSESATSTPSPSPSPTVTLKTVEENIQAGINSKNFAALTTYMTNPVSVILQATECCGPQTPQEAESQFSYVNDGIPFNFNQNSPTVVNLKSKNPELANTYIGTSQNTEHLIAFELNNQNQISQIRMSVSWQLFNN